MRIWTIARATWREGVRQPVSILILVFAAVVTYLSQFINFYHFDEEAGFGAIRQMAVAQALMCGMVIAVFTASAVLAEEIENRTMLTLLAKPVRRYEVILGKYLGILMTVAGAFLVMAAVSLVTVWWSEAELEKDRVNPVRAAERLPGLATGQGAVEAARTYDHAVTDVGAGRYPAALDTWQSAGDVLLLVTGQSSMLAARAPLAAEREVGWGRKTAFSPGLASLTATVLDFVPRTAVLLQGFVLAFVHVMVIASVAVAVATRLPLVFNALFCGAVFLLGNVSQRLGGMLAEAGSRGGLAGWLAAAARWLLCTVVPSLENFNLTDALSGGIERIRPETWIYGTAYGIAYSAFVLWIAVLLFRRREAA